MKNEPLIERLKVVGKYYNTHHDLFLLCREATERIEEQYKEIREIGEENIRMAEKVGQSNIKYMEVLNQLKAANINYNTAVAEIERLEAEVKEGSHANDGLYKRNAALVMENNRLSELLRRATITRARFPEVNIEPKEVNWNDDLSVRDQFACAALQGLYANANYDANLDTESEIAKAAYRQADAMLKAREKK
jgi:hypothetical protein